MIGGEQEGLGQDFTTILTASGGGELMISRVAMIYLKVGFTTSATKAVIPTLLNKSCSNQKINATLLFQF